MSDNNSPASESMPDLFDYTLGQLKDLPDVLMTKEATIRVVPPLGVGGSRLFVIQTIRQKERGDIILLEEHGKGPAKRLVLPPEVSAVIARQRDALTTKSRVKGARQAVATRLERGDQLGNPEALKKARRQRARKGGGK